MSEQTCRDECSAVLRGILAERGVEVTASTAPPIIQNEYTVDPYSCPHGVLFWLEPTSEQIARWAEAGAH
jgi:hypothetical protein